ncbi:PrgI family protein [Streptomyces sp. NPDC059479]|uniref:PrgI family protein n=1 Tax=Streptomyces sp. NPDC059479 TaxID=3346848 RepID=UPI0036CFE036
MTQPVRIPADVDREDTALANLTARQLLILAVTGIMLYGARSFTGAFVPLPVFLTVAVPVGIAAALLALGKRDGLSLDRLVLAAVRQRMSPRHRVSAPEGIASAPAWLTQQIAQGDRDDAAAVLSPAPLRLPAKGVTDTGVVDLGADGVAAVAVCSTVNFALRTPDEQESLVAGLGRYLHSLTAPALSSSSPGSRARPGRFRCGTAMPQLR